MNTFDVSALLAAVILVLVAGLLMAVEAAVGRVSRTRAQDLERTGKRGAGTLVRLLEDRARYVNVLLLGHQIASVVAIVLVTAACLDRIANDAVALVTAASSMSFVVYVVLGVGARTLGTQHAPEIGARFSGLTRVLAVLLGPLSRVLILVGNALTPGTGYRHGPFTTEAELLELVDLASDSSVIEDDEREMIHSVFEFGDTIAREVMVPRTEIVHVDADATLRAALAIALESGHSRVPVTGDNVDDIVGVVYLKDIARRTHEHAGNEEDPVSNLMRPALLVPDTKSAGDLLREMQTARVHMAILVDEYGGTSGLVTFEDLVEEIVGEITDEYDTETPDVEHLDDGTYLISTRMRVDDFVDLIGIEFDADKDGIDTVGGLLASRLGHVPTAGSHLEIGGWALVAQSPVDVRKGVQSVLLSTVPIDMSETQHEHPMVDVPDND